MTNISKYNKKPAIFITAIALFSLSSASLSETAPTAASAEKIFINADHMQMNIESGKSVYTGNVKISQGELKLTGEVVTLEQKDNEIDRITVTGKPARYNHVTEQGEMIEAESEHMVYSAGQNKLIMTINARLQQPDHQLSSQKIIYDTLKKTVIAGGGTGIKPANGAPGSNTATETESTQRVNITLTPKKAPAEKSPLEKK